ncbi:MAG: hypothetical protein ACTSRW_13195 [Candidatus Helarchaeota archaeon]
MVRQKIFSTSNNEAKLKNQIISLLKEHQTLSIDKILQHLEEDDSSNLKIKKNLIRRMIQNGELDAISSQPVSEKNRFVSALIQNLDVWLLLSGILLYLLFFSLSFYLGDLLLSIRIPLGLLLFYFIPGYFFTSIIFWKRSIRPEEQLVFAFGASIFISVILLFILNFTIFGLSLLFNYLAMLISLILGSILLLLRMRSPTSHQKIPSIQYFKRNRYIIILFALSFLTGILIRIWTALLQANFPINFPLDPWVHYAQVRVAMTDGILLFQSGYYQGYVPGLYLLLVGVSYITGSSIFLTFDITNIFNSVISIIAITALAYRLTRDKKILVLSCFFTSIVCFFSVIYSSSVTPQMISYAFIPLTLFAFIRTKHEARWQDALLMTIFCMYMTMSHVITSTSLIFMIVIINIFLYFTKNYNKFLLISSTLGIIFYGGWSLYFYGGLLFNTLLSFLPISLSFTTGCLSSSTFSSQAPFFLDLGKIFYFFLFLLITIMTPVFIKLHLRRHPIPRGPLFDYSKGALIVIAGFIIFLGNPFIWLLLGTTVMSEFMASINFGILLVIVYIHLISVFVIFLGFAMAYNRLGPEGMFICGAMLGNVYLTLCFGFFVGDAYFGRILQIMYDFNGILMAMLIVGTWRSLTKRRHQTLIKIFTFGIVLGSALPLTFLAPYSLYPNLQANTNSEYNMMQWMANQPNIEYYFTADFRLEYLIEGVTWSPYQTLQVINEISVGGKTVIPLYPDYYDDLLNAFNNSYPGKILLIPIVQSYFTVGPLTDFVFPDTPLNTNTLTFYNNQTTCNKIYDDSMNFLYAASL